MPLDRWLQESSAVSPEFADDTRHMVSAGVTPAISTAAVLVADHLDVCMLGGKAGGDAHTDLSPPEPSDDASYLLGSRGGLDAHRLPQDHDGGGWPTTIHVDTTGE